MSDTTARERLKSTSLYLPLANHRALKKAAIDHDCTISELLDATYRLWISSGTPALPLELFQSKRK